MPGRTCAAVAIAVAVCGCARALPPEPTSSALYRDLQRLVTLSQTAGWSIDRVELDELLPDALLSVCHVEPARRAALLAWLDARIAELGGPVEDAWRARGRDLRRVEELLETTRVRMLLARTIDVADADCPFWIEPRARFRGRQITDDRWILSFGGGGKGILLRQDGQGDVNFGGAGRLMLGRATGDRWTWLLGFELGASASFPREPGGDRSSLVLGFDAVIPAVARFRQVNSYWELEAGYLMHFTEDDTDVQPGVRLGVSFGGRASRKRWFFPGAVFGVSYERTFDGDLQLLKFGFRAAIDIPL